MGYEAKIILDSISDRGHRLTTIQATFPRFILAEINTHRQFSRVSASSRAIPVARRIEQIESDPFVPVAFGKNQAGMQAGDELALSEQLVAKGSWQNAIDDAVKWAKNLVHAGVHKQWANRVIETYAWHTAVITATEWSNHDALRCHPAASPEYRTIAEMMRDARAASKPMLLKKDEWHMPYVLSPDGLVAQDDFDAAHEFFDGPDRNPKTPLDVGVRTILRKVSVGRCAAVSYERQENKNFAKDVDRYGSLRSGGHMSPFEHVARPMTDQEYEALFCQNEYVWEDASECWAATGNQLHFCGNFNGWIQERKLIRNEHDFGKVAR